MDILKSVHLGKRLHSQTCMRHFSEKHHIYLGNEQAMLFVDGSGRYGPAAKLQGEGSRKESDAMLGRLRGHRLSGAEEKVRIGCPRCV